MKMKRSDIVLSDNYPLQLFEPVASDGLMVLRFLTGPVGLSKSQLSREIGITPSALGHFFKGRRPLPIARRKQLVEVLRRVVDEFERILGSRAAHTGSNLYESLLKALIKSGARLCAYENESLGART